MSNQDTLHREHVRSAIRHAGVATRLAVRNAVALERLAFGGALWYWCEDLESLNILEGRIRSGSVVSFYFDARIGDMHLGSDAASRNELISKLAVYLQAKDSEFREALVGILESDGLSIYVQYMTRSSEIEELVASLPDGHTFYGTFPDRSNDGIDAITLTVPDEDGVVRNYPH
jgi:hypothetical protein